jgi:hypothetical protein
MSCNVQKHESAIIEIQDFEIELVTAGTAGAAIAGRVFGALGVVQTVIWAGEQAYAAGKWLGRQ